MSKKAKWTLIIVLGVAALAGVFCGLFFGVPAFHDWICGVAKPEVKEPIEQGAETLAVMLRLK